MELHWVHVAVALHRSRALSLRLAVACFWADGTRNADGRDHPDPLLL
jgi:hypothetical protein